MPCFMFHLITQCLSDTVGHVIISDVPPLDHHGDLKVLDLVKFARNRTDTALILCQFKKEFIFAGFCGLCHVKKICNYIFYQYCKIKATCIKKQNQKRWKKPAIDFEYCKTSKNIALDLSLLKKMLVSADCGLCHVKGNVQFYFLYQFCRITFTCLILITAKLTKHVIKQQSAVLL